MPVIQNNDFANDTHGSRADMDKDREIMMSNYAAELQTDILMDYGYMISIMSDNPNHVYA